jgi:hypothetical protein
MPKFKLSPWLLVPVIALTVVTLIAQSPRRKLPSPADPGLRMQTNRPVQPSPSNFPQDARNPIPAGPKENKDENGNSGTSDDSYGDLEPSPRSNLVTGFDFFEVQAGSAFGNENDWVIMLQNIGEMEGEGLPIVHLGPLLKLKQVFIDPTSRNVYALIPAPMLPLIKNSPLEFIRLQNPGGLNRDPSRWIHVPFTQREFDLKLLNVEKVRFKHGPFSLQIAY